MKISVLKTSSVKFWTGIFTFALFVSSAAIAGNLTGMPNTFSANATAVANDVNANFEAARVEIDDNANNISDNTSNISGNTSNISGNASNISGNTAAIASRQSRVTGTCTAGQTISQINADGTVVCETGGAGSGLNADTLDGNSASDFATSGQTCPSGNVTGIDVSGNVICASGVSFAAVLNADITTAVSATEETLTGFGELHDAGNNFDPVTGVYTIPSNGVYQFILNVNLGSAATLSDVIGIVRLNYNGSIFQQMIQRVQLNSSYSSNLIVTGILKANAGDAITFSTTYVSGGPQVNILGGSGFLSTNVTGFKIY